MSWNWHIDAMAEHMAATCSGQIRELLITVPPGGMKSLTVSVMFHPWVWTEAPTSRWMCCSYIDKLAIRDNRKAKRLIESDWYQARWGHTVQISQDQKQKQRYENTKLGYRIAIAIGGSATGEKADFITVDDPHNADPRITESDDVRQKAVDWWREVMPTRLSDQRTGCKVVMGQRVHQSDLQQYCIDEGYEHLNLPMRYTGKSCVTVLGEIDPRTSTDEDDDSADHLLWPEMYPLEVVRKLERTLGTWATASQLQQEPVPRGSGKFPREWWGAPRIEVPLRWHHLVRYWDKAGTDDDGSYTAGVLMGYSDDGYYYILDVVRGQWTATRREPIMRQVAETDAQRYGGRHVVNIWHEQEPGSAGKESAANTTKNLHGFTVRSETATGDKFTRANPLAVQAEAGNVRIKAGRWNEDFLREMEQASRGSKDLDQMDGASGAFNKLSELVGEGIGEIIIETVSNESSFYGLGEV